MIIKQLPIKNSKVVDVLSHFSSHYATLHLCLELHLPVLLVSPRDEKSSESMSTHLLDASAECERRKKEEDKNMREEIRSVNAHGLMRGNERKQGESRRGGAREAQSQYYLIRGDNEDDDGPGGHDEGEEDDQALRARFIRSKREMRRGEF